MKAAAYDAFAAPITVRTLPEPDVTDNSVIVRVMATGVCRSDWHGWHGHDPDIDVLPHIPGHELAGVIETIGARVGDWQPGQRVTVPFVAGCGACEWCAAGQQQICDHQSQPGFTHWGSFAEFVRVDYADANLVELPDSMDFVTAASLGCRFATSFRAVVAQGRVCAGERVAVHGCGGVGLSAVMIAKALGAQVIAVDVAEAALATAGQLGAEVLINALEQDPVEEIRDRGGAHVSLDALGSPVTCANSVACLRKQGRHVQVGLITDGSCAIPMAQVIGHELELYGSHGLAAHEYPSMLGMIQDGRLDPRRLVSKRVSLEEGASYLMRMDDAPEGVVIIDRF